MKGKRATISPNFNFLGQLLEYEKQLVNTRVLPAKTNLTEHSLLKLSKERPENGESPSISDLNKTLSSSSPKHHVLHHHFNPHLMTANQEKKTNSNQNSSTNQITNQLADGTTTTAGSSLIGSSSSTINSSTSQFPNLNSNLNANGPQKRTCSFSSSPNTRNKMTLKLQSVNENENLGSIVFMWI